ncbi:MULTISPECIES: hypothetical protein [Flammeovirga]|uniref:Uncharacterized protein n=1 Tax=Flammeovirga agarivorans TaxID=2726742 RepID=A0A7X8SJE0_9BACT|nr:MULTISPECIES: hypothetical protein [Flammeovirga]NLR91208.1 hypothetical protein [Flammeovirga agarivorans]
MSDILNKSNEIRDRLNEEKAQLKKDTKKYRDDLVDVASETVSGMRTDVKKVLTYGAALVITYNLSNWAFKVGNKRSQKKYLKKLAKANAQNAAGGDVKIKNSKVPSFGKMLRDEAMVFLMGVAKEELINYLQTRKERRGKK